MRETLPVGPLGCNCTILACDETNEAVLVDPGGNGEALAEIVHDNELTVKAIIHTHAHFDHILGTGDVKTACGGSICVHPDDKPLYDGLAKQLERYKMPPKDALPADRWVEDDDIIRFGVHEIRVIHTPGHTPGSICFELRDADAGEYLLFAGDTLFRRGVGRTDLWGGDSDAIKKSIKNRLFTLTPETIVIPGHGPTTTIDEEKTANPYVRA